MRKSLAKGGFWLAVVECLPGGFFVGEGAEAIVVLGPVGWGQAQRVHPHFGAVEQLVDAANEVPAAVAALVGVVVADGLMDPPVAIGDLGLAVHVAGGMVVVDEVDLVGADIQDRWPDGSQRFLEVGPQSVAPVAVAAHASVVDEQLNEGIQVSPVDRHRVSGGELPDFLIGQQSGDVVHYLIMTLRGCLSSGEPISGRC